MRMNYVRPDAVGNGSATVTASNAGLSEIVTVNYELDMTSLQIGPALILERS